MCQNSTRTVMSFVPCEIKAEYTEVLKAGQDCRPFRHGIDVTPIPNYLG